jgi:2-keto-4-pentenoate hydratase/2-oxohepta-3-ene-1,7-dioic acid hydratase in catechol pathway
LKFLSFNLLGFERLGWLLDDGETVLAIDRESKGMPQTLKDVIKRGPYARHQIKQAEDSMQRLSIDDIELLPPIIPWATFSITANSSDPAEAEILRNAAYPTISLRTPRNHVAQNVVIDIPLKTKTLECEGKLVVVIGRTGRYITLEHASRYIFGYSIYNEGSVKEFRNHTSQFGLGGMFDTSAAFGPYIITADEVNDPYQQTIETRIDGELVQSSSLSSMRHSIEETIVYISSAVTLFPGDIICIGIPTGDEVKPERLLQPNQHMEISISSIGTLSNKINDEPSTPRTVGCC